MARCFCIYGVEEKTITEKGSVDALLRPCLRYTVTRRQDPPQKSYIRYVVELVRVNGYRRLEKYVFAKFQLLYRKKRRK